MDSTDLMLVEFFLLTFEHCFFLDIALKQNINESVFLVDTCFSNFKIHDGLDKGLIFYMVEVPGPGQNLSYNYVE